MPETNRNVCPECGYPFKGNGFDGIEAHWRANHEEVMLYCDAWPKIKNGTYRRIGKSATLSPCASGRYWEGKKGG